MGKDNKLDGVALIDNRVSTELLQIKKKKNVYIE